MTTGAAMSFWLFTTFNSPTGSSTITFGIAVAEAIFSVVPNSSLGLASD